MPDILDTLKPEHDRLRDLFARIVATDSRPFAGSVQVCGETIKHHAHEEKTRMFDAARQLFGAEELAERDASYARWKDFPAAAIEGYARFKTSARALVRNPDSPA